MTADVEVDRLTPAQCIARGLMPQVDEADLPGLVEFLRERGIKVWTEACINPRLVRGVQKVNRKKVHALPLDVSLNKPVLVARDRKIIDGNHRWMKLVHRKMPCMKTHVVDLPFDEAIKNVFEYPKTYYYDDGKYHPIVN